MATQIAPTPTIRGDEAIRVLQEARQKPDKKTIDVFAMFKEEFSNMVSSSTSR